MEKKLTPWFAGTVKPVRVGVYQRDYRSRKAVYCKWNGRYWGWGNVTPAMAVQCTEESGSQYLPWRGLAQDPDA